MGVNITIEIPGVSGTIDSGILNCYTVNFNRDDIDPRTLNNFIYKGDYRSDFPFSICVSGGKYYIFTPSDLNLNEIMIINRYIGRIKKKVDFASTKVPLTDYLKNILLHSAIDFIFIKHGFEKPVNVRTFLGKSSKGKLSNRKKEILRFSIPGSLVNQEYILCPSVNYSTFISQDKFKVFLLPNHEIYGEKLNIPIDERLRQEAFAIKKVKEEVFFKPARFEELCVLYTGWIIEGLCSQSWIERPVQCPLEDSLKLERNFTIASPFIKETKKIDEKVSFQESIYEFLLNDNTTLTPLDIELYIDEHLKDDLRMLEYIDKIDGSKFFHVNSRCYFPDSLEFSLDPTKLYYFIIDDKIPGREYIYKNIKAKSKKTKSILASTIIKTFTDFSKHALIVWLSFISRSYKRFPIFKKFECDYQIVLAIHFYKDSLSNSVKLSYSALDLSKNSIHSEILTYFLSSRKSIPQSTLLEAILLGLKNKIDIEEKNTLLIIEDDRYSTAILEILNNKSNLAIIKKENCRILEQTENRTVTIPEDGVYYKIFQAERMYLLVSTGRPDQPEDGLPNPILVTFSSKVPNQIETLQIIFDLTFFQYKMYGKNTIPNLLKINKDNLDYNG